MSALSVDDSDSSIVYSQGDWFVAGEPPEFDSMTHYTTTAGATVQIPFSGTYIKVFGTVTAQFSPDPVSAYSVDHGAGATFAPDSSTLSQNAHHVLFFQSGTLAGGNHNKFSSRWPLFPRLGGIYAIGPGGNQGYDYWGQSDEPRNHYHFFQVYNFNRDDC
ncbi:hypothetical protein C8J56DRAFT_899184 [Mycena floridula]|nr:hypothetical protein C8J56DRAFT_899184 [Mycena floridula]